MVVQLSKFTKTKQNKTLSCTLEPGELYDM